MYICPFLYLMSLASQSVTGCALGHKHFTVCLFVVLGFLCASSLSLNPYGWGWRPSMLMQLGGGCLFASPPSFPSGEGLGFSFPSTAGLCTVLYDSVLFARIRIHDLSIRESHPSTHGYRHFHCTSFKIWLVFQSIIISHHIHMEFSFVK